MNGKPTIAFITGGYSTEAVVSYKSAITIENNVDRDKFDVYKIDIRPEGWFCDLQGNGKTPIDRNDFTLQHNGKKIKFDAVLVGIHGTPGEDGKLQGYFDLLNIPYTSCDAATSVLTAWSMKVPVNQLLACSAPIFALSHSVSSLIIYSPSRSSRAIRSFNVIRQK